jgi:large subunit ribosomal protein L15
MAEKERLLQVHHLKPAKGATTSKTRVGRGDASKGKTAGRGTKGTKARGKVRAGFEGGQMPIHMRLPKLHGFKNYFRKEYQTVNLKELEEKFPKGGNVNVINLVEKGLVRKNQLVKVLGSGDVKQKFELEVNKISKSADEKIQKAGGTVQLVNKIVKKVENKKEEK